jgi:hypothetical protein
MGLGRLRPRFTAFSVVIVTLAALAAYTPAPQAVADGFCGAHGAFTAPSSCTYTLAGEDTFTVPSGASDLKITATGGGGGSGTTGNKTGGSGGLAATVIADVPAPSSGTILYVEVGSFGSNGSVSTGGSGGANGGGSGGSGSGAAGGGGGGESDVRTCAAGPSCVLTGDGSDPRLVVAGGGGGGGGGSGGVGGAGGAAGASGTGPGDGAAAAGCGNFPGGTGGAGAVAGTSGGSGGAGACFGHAGHVGSAGIGANAHNGGCGFDACTGGLGGGGGGGYFGGGSGGSSENGGGGGGGAGSSFPSSATISTAGPTVPSSITITVPPDAPTLTSTDPASPSPNTSLRVIGSAPDGTTVHLYTTSDCSGTAVGSGTAAQLAPPGIATSASGGTTTFYAKATDTFANDSPCSSTSVSYIAEAPSSQITVTDSIGEPDRGDTFRARDGDITTDTYTTPSSTNAQPGYLDFGFASTPVDRIRLYKDDYVGPHDLTIQYTTDSGSLPSRSWTNVSGLANGFFGTELLQATSVNTDGTVTGEHHNSEAPVNDGWASLTFDPVTATGIRIGFTNSSSCFCNHLHVFEFEAHFVDYPPATSIAISPASPNGSNNTYVTSPHVTVSATDTDTTGVGETRCVLDPSTAPVVYDDIPSGCAYTGAGADVTSQGTHTLYAASADTAGNQGSVVSSTFKVDTTAPSGGVTFPADAGVYARTASPTWNAGCSTDAGDICGTASDNDSVQKVEVSVEEFGVTSLWWDGTAFESTTEVFNQATSTNNWSLPIDITDFPADGHYGMRIRITDAAGNTTTTSSRDFSVDPTPSAVIVDHPSSLTNATTASFTYSSPDGGVSFECRAPGTTTFTACANSGVTYGSGTPLSDGTYTFKVRTTDSAGRVSSTNNQAGFSWTVDTTPPDTQIIAHPSDPTNHTSASFAFGVVSNDGHGSSTFTCQLDSGSATACNTGGAIYPTISAGDHTFTVYATDHAGNADASPASFSWTVDTTPPTTPSIDSGPNGPTDDQLPTFTFSDTESGVTFQCSLVAQGDPANYRDCSGATSDQPSSALADGPYVFTVEALDAAGNTATASRSFSVDTTGPTAEISSGPADGSTTGPDVAFTYTTDPVASDNDHFECALSTGGAPSFSTCDNDGQSYHDLVDGTQYTFSVRAVDTLGNTGPTDAVTWTVSAARCGTNGTRSGSVCTYTTTGTDSFTVPTGVTTIRITAAGAQGADAGNAGGAGGKGGRATGVFTVTPGSTLVVTVGAAGSGTSGGSGGGGGGGSTDCCPGREGAGGGGASDVRTDSTPATRIVVGGGGGGGGGGNQGNPGCGPGGSGGGASGGDGGTGVASTSVPQGGSGGSQTGAGAGGAFGEMGSGLNEQNGSNGSGSGGGDGGSSYYSGGGGGGGGYFGGGGGGTGFCAGGGGGGSGFVDGSATHVAQSSGVQSGDGTVVIDYAPDLTAPAAPTVAGPKKTKSRRPKFTFSDAAPDLDHYTCTLDGTPQVPCNNPFQPATKLKFGGHTLVVTAVDAAGNQSAATTKNFKVIH